MKEIKRIKNMSFKLDENEERALKNNAKSYGMTISQFIRTRCIYQREIKLTGFDDKRGK